MSNILDTKISFYKTIHSKENSSLLISDLFKWIKDQKYRTEIGAIKIEVDKAKRDELNISGEINRSVPYSTMHFRPLNTYIKGKNSPKYFRSTQNYYYEPIHL